MTFEKGNKLSAGHGSRPKKSYTIAVQEMLDTIMNDRPSGWPEDRKQWTHAQELAEIHMSQALSGNEAAAKMIVERAEGRVPTAPEDRESGELQAGLLGAGLTALQKLQMALGLRQIPIEVESQPALPPHKETNP